MEYRMLRGIPYNKEEISAVVRPRKMPPSSFLKIEPRDYKLKRLHQDAFSEKRGYIKFGNYNKLDEKKKETP